MLDSMPESITRFRPEGARDFMVAAATYQVQDQNGIYGEDSSLIDWDFVHLFASYVTE
jgi:hypothetical protein